MGSELQYIRKCQNFWKHDLVHEYDCQYDVGSWDWIVDHFNYVKGEQIECFDECCLYFTKVVGGKDTYIIVSVHVLCGGKSSIGEIQLRYYEKEEDDGSAADK